MRRAISPPHFGHFGGALSAEAVSDCYEFVLDAVQALCRKAKVYPFLLGAAIFASFDKGRWTEETVVG